MAPQSAEKIAAVEAAEKKLNSAVSDGEYPAVDLLRPLEELRQVCHRLILDDYQYANLHDVEARLWVGHTKVNSRFRKDIAVLQRDKSKSVEIRKILKHYLQFLKSSQRFYREYILHLHEGFGGIDELFQVARNWAPDHTKQSVAKNPGQEIRTLIVGSCYQALIHLGDLSRYRETELKGQERNWGPAVGYYNLAIRILPKSGVAHNQQAVVALADGNHLRGIYHLYRSLSAEVPHPSARGNLELEFKKIISAWDRGEPLVSNTPKDGVGTNRALTSWFVRLHSKCYKGVDFPQHEELENEVITQLASELKEGHHDGRLQIIVLVNVAAQYSAALKLCENGRSQETSISYNFFLRLNIKTFLMLLQQLHRELAGLDEDSAVIGDEPRSPKLVDKITPIMRRVLPGARLYSLWLTSNWTALSTNTADEGLRDLILGLWKQYASTLTEMTSAFPAKDLPGDNYMLEEDVNTISFVPLISDKTAKTWEKDGSLKPRYSDENIGRLHPTVEMLVRIRDFLVNGLELAVDESAPLVLRDLQFIYQETGLQPQSAVISTERTTTEPPFSVTSSDMLRTLSAEGGLCGTALPEIAKNEPVSIIPASDAAMNRMVDDLVGQDDGTDQRVEETEFIRPTKPIQSALHVSPGNDTSYGLEQLNGSDVLKLLPDDIGTMSRATATDNAKQVKNSPIIRTLPYLPSLPDESGIWNPKQDLSAPSSPLKALREHSLSRSHGIGSSGHSRNPSLNSPKISQMTGGSISSFEVTIDAIHAPQIYNNCAYKSGTMNNGSFGNGWYAHAKPFKNEDTYAFGAVDLKSSTPGRSQNSFGRTPPNGQGG